MGYKVFNFIMFRTIQNLFTDIKKNKNIHVILIFLGLISISKFKIIIPIILFFLYMIIKTLPQCFYYLKYYSLNLEKTYVLNVKKTKKFNKITIYSYLDTNSLKKRRSIFNNYFNIVTTNIEQQQKRIFIVTGTIGKTENNLINILSGYGHLLSVKSETETDFYYKYELKIDSDIKDILKLKDDISFKLKKRVSIELKSGLYVFKLHKPVKKKYYFNKIIKTIDKPDVVLPVLLGINQETGEIVIGDLKKMLNTFINGIVGSGKSCLFNTMIQSFLLWNNCKMVFVDFKRVEFPQYRDFDNTIVITKMDDFLNFLDEILKEMDNRYIEFEKLGVKNIDEHGNMEHIIICIDEIAFISAQKNQAEIWEKLITLIQMGRASGIILICATQCPDHTQINTSFRRQVDSKIIGRLRQQSDLKICGVDIKEDITDFDVGEFIVNALGVGEIKIKSLFLEGLTHSLTQNLTRLEVRKNKAISGVDLTKHDKTSKNIEKNLTENEKIIILVENYFSRLKPDSTVPSFKEAKKYIPELTEKLYKNVKIELYNQEKIYKTTPTATKYKIKK